MAPRKVRLTANLIKNMAVPLARAQMSFMVKKPAPLILKLLNSAAANAKQNFNIEENNLYVAKILVESGATLKRWLPRAMGRATPIMKRTCSVRLVLGELTPAGRKIRRPKKPEVLKEEEVLPAGEKSAEIVPEKAIPESKPKPTLPARPYGTSGQAKKRYFSRQTFGNIRKMFRRKSI